MLVDRFMLLLKFTAQFTYNLKRLMILFLNVNEFLTASLFLFGKEIFPTKKTVNSAKRYAECITIVVF